MTQSATAAVGGIFDPDFDYNFTGQQDFVKCQVSSPTGYFGYATGAGGAVTQLTSKSTGVTLNTMSGDITLNNANLATVTVVSFTLTNTNINATDTLVLNHASAGTVGSYLLNAQCAAGSATINVTNISGGTLGEAIVVRFAILRCVKS
jgi:hypothetical protein